MVEVTPTRLGYCGPEQNVLPEYPNTVLTRVEPLPEQDANGHVIVFRCQSVFRYEPASLFKRGAVLVPFHACSYLNTGSYPNTRIHVITRIPECSNLPEQPDRIYCPTTRTDFYTRIETLLSLGLHPSMGFHPTTRIRSITRLPEYTFLPEYPMPVTPKPASCHPAQPSRRPARPAQKQLGWWVGGLVGRDILHSPQSMVHDPKTAEKHQAVTSRVFFLIW